MINLYKLKLIIQNKLNIDSYYIYHKRNVNLVCNFYKMHEITN